MQLAITIWLVTCQLLASGGFQSPDPNSRNVGRTERQRVPATCELPERAALGPAYELQMNAGTQSGDSRPPLAYVVCRLAIDESDEDQQARETCEKFLAVLTKNPRPGTALEKVIEYHTDNGTVDEFIQQLRDDAESNNTSWMIIGLLESHRQNHAEAVAAFEQAEAKRPDDALPSWMLGRSLAELDRHVDAAVALERAITKNPDRATLLQIYQDLGRAYRRAQQPDKANDVWQRMETKFPSDVRVKEQIAATLLDEGDFENCLRRYEELATLQTDPSLAAQSRMVVGDLQMKLGQTEAARKTFEDVMSQLDSESWLYREARRRIEDLFAQQDNPEALIAYYDQWLKDHPEDLDAMVRLARSLAGQFRYDEARRWYRTAIEKAPSRVDLRKAMIEQWLREDNVTAAIDEYQRLAELDPANTDHLEAWGLLCLKRNDQPLDQRKAAAKAVWMRLLQDFESDATRHLRVADLLRRAELLDDALAYYQKAVELSNGDPPAVESLAQCLMAMNRRDDAIATLRQLAEGTRRSTANLLQLATSFATINETELALQATREACELTPSFQDRLLLVRRLRDFRKDGQHPFAAESLDQLAKAEALVESDEDRRLIRDEKILCLTTAGLMESQIEALARSNSERDDVSVDDWTTLATYYAAIGRRSEASEAIGKALAIHADNVEALSLAAELYEETGRLQDAADARRRLKGLDRRRQSEHLSRLVNLERRLHQTDAAFATAKELLNATPGNPDAVNLYADLCFQSNRPDEGLNALRRLVRNNPSDQEARFRLAEMLTQLQRTAEAEEVWWQTLLAVEDRTLQEQIVTSLADLALKSERLDVLLKRLEQRGRELNRRTDASRWRAAAFQKVEDFVSARQSLESVLTEDKQDVEILQQLSSLCESMGDLNAAIEFQRRIEAAAPSDDGKLRLTTLLIQSGEMTEADALLARVAKLSGSSPELMKAIDQLTEAQELDAAKQLCERVLTEQPNHWLVLQKLIVIEWQRANFEAVDALVERVLEMRLSWRTPVKTLVQRYSDPSSTLDTREATRLWASRVTPEIVDATLGEPGENSTDEKDLLLPNDFGDVRMFCLEMKRRRTSRTRTKIEWIASLEANAESDQHAAWDRWGLACLDSDDTSEDSVVASGKLNHSLRLSKFGNLDGKLALLDATIGLFYEGTSNPPSKTTLMAIQVSDIELIEILTAFRFHLQNAKRTPLDFGWTIRCASAVATICEQFGQMPMLKRLVEELSGRDASIEQLRVAFWLSSRASIDKSEKDLLQLADRILIASNNTLNAAKMQSNTLTAGSFAFSVASKISVEPEMSSRDPSGGHERVFEWWLSHKTRQSTPQGIPDFIVTPTFDQKGVSEVRGKRFLRLFNQLDDHDLRFLSYLQRTPSDGAGHLSVDEACDSFKAKAAEDRIAFIEVVQAQACWQRDELESCRLHLINAREKAPENAELMVRLADLSQMTGRLDDSLKLVERVPDLDARFIQKKHLKMLELATGLNNVEKARDAIDRLSGLLLNPDSQSMIIDCLKTLNLTDEANQFQAKMGKAAINQPPRRGYVQASPFLYGKRLEALRKGENKTATVDFAKQILRRTQNAAWFSGRSSEDRDKLREKAFDVLRHAGELGRSLNDNKPRFRHRLNLKNSCAS